jgi:glycosyltransferase involved in cell wall biosynthesis
MTIRAFLLPHIRVLREHSRISVIGNGIRDDCGEDLGSLGVETIDVPIARQPAPLADFRASRLLQSIFRANEFDAVVSVTPKAGFLGMTAARIAGVPVRAHWFTGQVWASRKGLARSVLRRIDGITAASATHLLSDSKSQRTFLEREGVADPGVITVIGDGSISGVDPHKFRPDADARLQVRDSLGIPGDAFVFVFLGRLARDKGIRELAEAFRMVADFVPDAHLLVVGPDEGEESARTLHRCRLVANRVHLMGMTQHPESQLAASDLLVLPSYREGFGTTVLEAAACGIPAIASNIYGLSDAVVDGLTGVLVPPRDPEALATKMLALAKDRIEVGRLGFAARARALERFHTSRLTSEFSNYLRTAIHRTHQGR